MHWMDGFGGGWMMILWWGIIIAAIIVIIKFFVSSGRPQNQKSAMDILKERYARGEISKEEFEEKKKDLLS
ncbi:SHOCT domain-containing protein [Balneolaceae bacterium YR4-1]|uniref:SHOCT domain-containing protein n=1 Tax=Halalkalibaculum roseum TaxID=2709311 RepID=A0A6M1SWS1_9BACT|nr:SHOCT domain-containing protein [Halalkalibaculum roseum]NGP75514.1 SHOCT domain-containing protein [Halalkalibaculum roseum]